VGGGRSKRAKAVSEEPRGETAEIRTCDTGTTGLTPIRAATRLAAAAPGTAGSCPQPPGHFDEEIQPGPSWCPFLPDFRQQQTLDRLQHCVPQLGLSRSASRSKPEPYGIRRRRSRRPAAAGRQVARNVARGGVQERFFRSWRCRWPSKPIISWKGSVAQNRKPYSRLAYVSRRWPALFDEAPTG
jgi:hypothetical protein